MTDPRVARTRERVLTASRELFLNQGLESLSHLSVARASGVGRKTIYRHWPTIDELIHDVLDSTNLPQAQRVGAVRVDLLAHLEALRQALIDGPLAFVIHSLGARAALHPEFIAVRDRLTERGCAPVREILREAINRGELPAGLDVEAAASQIEGPLFYRTLVRCDAVSASQLVTQVDHFLKGAVIDAEPKK
ncbi:MAG: TetR/AcrR family transcriptional regulator [Rhodoglobus sp.]